MTPGSHPLLGCCGGHEVTSSTRPVPKEAAQSGPPGRAARPEPLPALLGALCLSIDCEGDPDLSGSLQKRPETGPRGGRELRKLGEERSLRGRSPGSRSRGGVGGRSAVQDPVSERTRLSPDQTDKQGPLRGIGAQPPPPGETRARSTGRSAGSRETELRAGGGGPRIPDERMMGQPRRWRPPTRRPTPSACGRRARAAPTALGA